MNTTQRDELSGIVASNFRIHPNKVAYVDHHAAADAILAAGYRKLRTITTVDELDALQHGSIVINKLGEAISKYGEHWFFPGVKHRFAVSAIALPASILHVPEVEVRA